MFLEIFLKIILNFYKINF